jgi:aldehyde dehydrogenase (NAD+)
LCGWIHARPKRIQLTDVTAIVPEQDFAALVQQQRTYFAGGATLPISFRLQALRNLKESLISGEKPLLAALHADLRKPPMEAYAAEIGMVISEIDFAIKHLKAWLKPSRRSVPWMVWPASAHLSPRPLGLTLIIGPWNYPVQLLLIPLIGAIAGGNCAIVKPSELTPKTSEAIASLLSKTFSPDYIACVQGDRAVTETLLRERFDKIFFTGGGIAGRSIAAAAARNLTPVTLELGGKCPVIVCADADIVVAARRIIWAKTVNAGQSCVAPDYLLVDESIRAKLLEGMIAAIRQMFGEDAQKSADFGRIVNRRHFDRLSSYLKEGTILSGGQNDPADLYFAPTLLGNLAPGAQVLEEEVFGPILPVIPFEDISEAVKFIQNRPSPLAVYLFTANRTLPRQIEPQIRCGGFCVNDLVVQLFGKHLPFGGVGESGMGSYHGKASFECFTHLQSVLECSTRFDSAFRYAPPKQTLDRYRRVLSWLLRG